jgi:hypothetical protein
MSPIESYKEAMFVRYNLHFVDKQYADEALERIKLYENNCSDKCTMHYVCLLNDDACTIHKRLKDSLLIEMTKDKGSL